MPKHRTRNATARHTGRAIAGIPYSRLANLLPINNRLLGLSTGGFRKIRRRTLPHGHKTEQMLIDAHQTLGFQMFLKDAASLQH